MNGQWMFNSDVGSGRIDLLRPLDQQLRRNCRFLGCQVEQLDRVTRACVGAHGNAD
jgi:hypothetical protein